MMNFGGYTTPKTKQMQILKWRHVLRVITLRGRIIMKLSIYFCLVLGNKENTLQNAVFTHGIVDKIIYMHEFRYFKSFGFILKVN